MSKSQTSKLLFLSLIILLLLIVFGTIKLPQNQKRAKVNQETLSGLTIAKNMTQFLDTTIKPDGSFNLSYYCNKEVGCALEVPKGPPHSGQIVAFYSDLGTKTNDPLQTKKADKAMALFLSKCKQDLDYCQWNFFPLFSYYQSTKDKKYLEAMLSVKDQLLSQKPLIEIAKDNIGVKLAMLYQLTNDKVYLDRLENLAQRVLSGEISNDKDNPVVYKESSFLVRRETFYSLWSIVLPAYKATKKAEYLKVVKDTFDQANLLTNIDKIKATDDLQSLMVATDVLSDLSDITKDPKYSQTAKQITQRILTDLLDSPSNKKFNGDWGLLTSFQQGSNHKSPLQNAALGRQLLRFPEEQFQI